VAPGDVEASHLQDVFSSWRPIALTALPFLNFDWQSK